eukprot:TRINITY_DN30061_c0_g1_i2.p1 TRINITY_DN30061_c0_g1~~TRINITY_DN30061_c0_g1_i2.p1  ORF type:complete len:191 (+),score=33.39 TRINITY_DN30061_c0_g1_i2:446-1018(+)
MKRLWRRVNEAAGPYQMFGELADAIVFRCAAQDCSVAFADYLEEVPASYLQEDPQMSAQPHLLLRFVYGKRFSPIDLPSPGAVSAEFAELSAFLHPRLELFAGLEEAARGLGLGQRPLMTHAMVEDVFTEWEAHVGHLDPLLRFLEACFQRAETLLREGRGPIEPDGGSRGRDFAEGASALATSFLKSTE